MSIDINAIRSLVKQYEGATGHYQARLALKLADLVSPLVSELERVRTDERNTIAADIENMPINLGDDGWKHLERKADEANYPTEWVRRRRTRDDFTTATIEVAYQYGYRQAAKVARGEVAS